MPRWVRLQLRHILLGASAAAVPLLNAEEYVGALVDLTGGASDKILSDRPRVRQNFV